jgi:SAM-dependent methyltransferase
MSELPRRVNLGCGTQKRPDCLNVDLRESVAPDLVLDLGSRPYPLPRDHFEYAYALDVIEHLDDVQGFLEEVHSILAPGGTLEITTPHFSCANSYSDPTHRKHLGYFSFDDFTGHSPRNFYSPVRFEMAARLLVFHSSLPDRALARFANRHPAFYERRLTWIFPAWFLIFKLRAVKGPV